MGIRGRKSNQGLPLREVPTLRTRMSPPPELTAAQKKVWRGVVADRPVAWFDRSTAPLLVAYCRATVAQTVLSKALAAIDPATPEGSATYRRLMALQEAQAKLAIRLATAMRLSQHSRHSVDAGTTAAREGQSAAKLWERK